MAAAPRRALRIGLTGGIASGKSTVAAMFAARGVPVVDTDEIARQLVRPGEAALAEIAAAFGDAVIAADGTLDRAALRARVFAADEARRRLEAILHPRIEAATVAACERAAGPYLLVVIPLLVEAGLARLVDRVLVVDCPAELQLQRLLQRDAAPPEQAERMLAAQASREARLAQADDVIENGGNLDTTERRVEELHQRYLHLACERHA